MFILWAWALYFVYFSLLGCFLCAVTILKSDVCRFSCKTPLLLNPEGKKFTSRPEIFFFFLSLHLRRLSKRSLCKSQCGSRLRSCVKPCPSECKDFFKQKLWTEEWRLVALLRPLLPTGYIRSFLFVFHKKFVNVSFARFSMNWFKWDLHSSNCKACQLVSAI